MHNQLHAVAVTIKKNMDSVLSFVTAANYPTHRHL
jgi:hypothetical protein